ncbi:MAG: tetrahydrofolate synthase [Spirochaetaceae bacterium]|jgi:dihydrofolate synthase/folylpolyglutamate synthase|nr:tetrahydrofolate synthase [Spirochaetaceae bacterium]
MHFNNSAAVFSWIEGSISSLKEKDNRTFRLERMQKLAELAGEPQKSVPAIHIAGSKGKGSVTGMIASILAEAGMDPGRYSSPHVSDYRERICRGLDYFDEAVYVKAGNELYDLAVGALRATPLQPPPTFFELMTLYYFLCCRAAAVRTLVVETGLGGRLDATNVIEPQLCVITSMELEHTEYLGDTIEQIAMEKAGIIKPGKPVLVMKQEEPVYNVLKQKAEELNAPFYYLPDLIKIENIEITKEGTAFDTSNSCYSCHSWLKIPGKIQAANAATAIFATNFFMRDNKCKQEESFTHTLDEETIQRGLAKFQLPARFERLAEGIIVDGAHTPNSVALTLETFCNLYGEGGVLLFGCAASKNIESMAGILSPHFSKIVLTRPGNFLVSDMQREANAFKDANASLNANTIIEPSPEAAVDKALELGRPLLCIGSFYLAGIFREKMK